MIYSILCLPYYCFLWSSQYCVSHIIVFYCLFNIVFPILLFSMIYSILFFLYCCFLWSIQYCISHIIVFISSPPILCFPYYYFYLFSSDIVFPILLLSMLFARRLFCMRGIWLFFVYCLLSIDMIIYFYSLVDFCLFNIVVFIVYSST
jgi:hypothetical protein